MEHLVLVALALHWITCGSTEIDRSHIGGNHGLNSYEAITPIKNSITNNKSKAVMSYEPNNLRHLVMESGAKMMDGIMRTLRGGRHEDQNKGRFLNIFEVVNFNNVDCVTASGLRGTCLHAIECAQAMGVQSETCAEGYGVCCIFQYSCGQATSSNCSTFTSPGFPNPSVERLSCSLTVHKAHEAVKQLRLDFVQMELQPPRNGTCSDDQFVVTGQSVNSIVPILCGVNNGQHVYVDVEQASGPFDVSVLSANAASRLFHIRICQISSMDDPAPSGCLQYHTGSEGVVESFNYQVQADTPSYRVAGYYNNLNYAICIRREPGSCSITYYTDGGDDPLKFQILNYDADGVPLIPPGQAGAEIFNCPDDFIVVNGIRLCGERLNDASVIEDFSSNAPVTELGAGPIALLFRTSGNVTGRGFRLFYRQNPCAKMSNLF